MKMIRLDARRAKPISCVTTTIVMPSCGERRHHRQHFVDHLGVQRAGGLVEQHDLGVHREGPGDGDTLLLTAPDSWAGYLSAWLAMPTRSSSAIAFACAFVLGLLAHLHRARA